MEVYLIGCLVAFVAMLLLLATRETFELTSGDLLVLLAATALSWGSVAVCLPVLFIMFFASEETQYRLYISFQNLYDKLKEICDRQEHENKNR